MISMIHSKGGNPLGEGIRLAFLNLIYILGSIGIFMGILYIGVGFLAMLFLMMAGFGYFYFWIEFSRTFARHVQQRKVLKTVIVGMIGILPNICILAWFMFFVKEDPNSCGAGAIVGYLIFLGSSVVMPFLSLLSSFAIYTQERPGG